MGIARLVEIQGSYGWVARLVKMQGRVYVCWGKGGRGAGKGAEGTRGEGGGLVPLESDRIQFQLLWHV